MDAALRKELIDALLDVPGVRDAQMREQLLAGLPDRLHDTLTWTDNPLVDIAHLVDQAVAWEMVGQVIDNAAFLASGSGPVTRLEALRPRLGAQGNTPLPLLQPPPPPMPWAERPEFTALRDALCAGGSVALSIAGRGGLGKTALAAKLAADPNVRAAYPDGVFWIGLGQTPDLLTALASLAQALGGDVRAYPDEEGRAATVRGLLAGRRCLLVYDDAWTVEVTTRCRDLAPAAALLTTRHHDVARAFAARQTTALAGLAPPVAVALLRELMTVDIDEAELVRAAALAGGLPLTLSLLAGLLDDEAHMGTGCAALLAELEDPARRQAHLTAQDAIVSKSIAALPEADRAAFVALAVFGPRPATFDRTAAAAVWAVEDGAAWERLKRFVARSLVDAEGGIRFALHQSLWDAAASRLQIAYPDSEAAIRDAQSPLARHAAHYLALVERDPEDWRAIAAELEQITRAWVAVAPEPVQTLAFIWTMRVFQERQGLWRDYLSWSERGLEAARVLGQREDEGTLLNNMGWAYNSLGERQRALEYFQQARPLQEAVGDRTGLADTLSNIGLVYYLLGERQRALEYYQQARAIQEAVGDHTGLADTLSNIGRVYRVLAEWQRALEYYQQARSIQEAVGDRAGLAHTLGYIGRVYRAFAEWQRALEYCQQARSIQEAVGDRAGLTSTLTNIGRIYDALGERQRALEYYQQARSIQEEVGDRAGLARTICNIGQVYDALGEGERALEYFQQARSIQEAIGNRRGLARTLSNIGQVYDALGERQRALEYLQQARPLQEAVGDRYYLSITLYNMAMVYRNLDDRAEAVRLLEQVVVLAEAVRHPDLESDRAALELVRAELAAQGPGAPPPT